MREMSKIKHFANTWFNTLGNETKTIFGKVSMIPISNCNNQSVSAYQR